MNQDDIVDSQDVQPFVELLGKQSYRTKIVLS